MAPDDLLSLPARMRVFTVETEAVTTVTLWLNDLDLVLGISDMDGISRDELYRRVGEIVFKQGLGIRYERPE